MNKKTIIGSGLVFAALIGGIVTLSYKSIQISSEAKNKVIEYSKMYKMSQRDTASKIILDYATTTYQRGYEASANDFVKGMTGCITSTSQSDVFAFVTASSSFGFYCKDLRKIVQTK